MGYFEILRLATTLAPLIPKVTAWATELASNLSDNEPAMKQFSDVLDSLEQAIHLLRTTVPQLNTPKKLG